jgi:hypothetical protein
MEEAVPQPVKDHPQPTTKLEEFLYGWSTEDFFCRYSGDWHYIAEKNEFWDLAINRLIEVCASSRTQIEGIGRALIAVAKNLPLKDWEKIEADRCKERSDWMMQMMEAFGVDLPGYLQKFGVKTLDELTDRQMSELFEAIKEAGPTPE